MKASWSFPWPSVTTNNLYFNRRTGGRVLCSTARDWKMLAAAVVRHSGVTLRPDARVRLTIWQYPPKGARCDVDANLKLCLDAIFLALGGTDHRVCELHTYRGPNGDSARIDVVMESADWRTLDEVRR